MVGMHVIYILFCLTAVSISSVRAFTKHDHPHTMDGILIYLLTHAAWPPILWLVCLIACWAPVHYAIFPPTMPDREELLDRDPVTLVAHPRAGAKRIHWARKNVLHEILYFGLTLYTTAAFVMSFIW